MTPTEQGAHEGRRYVEVVQYDRRWPFLFAEEAEWLREMLGEECLLVSHIGSTSVPGMWAKPIIDILLVVRELSAVDARSSSFVARGYEPLGEYGIPGRRFFPRGKLRRSHHLHCFAAGAHYEIERHLAVCAYLRKHADERVAYSALKRSLARQYPWDIEGYWSGKVDYVADLQSRALLWYQGEVAAQQGSPS